MAKKKGKFIVIDGIDGVGKATQTKELVKRLKKEGCTVKTIDFPQYEKNFFGALLGEYLSGEYGDFIEVDPHIASVLYAADRFESSKKIREWLDDGYVVISDRYVSANQIHQGGKIHDARKRTQFLKWLEKMEYGVFSIPKPDSIFFLDVPTEISQRWLKKKKAQRTKKYLKGRRDVAEDNLKHLEDSKKSAIKLVKETNKWHHVDCSRDGEIMSISDIHDIIFGKVKRMLKL